MTSLVFFVCLSSFLSLIQVGTRLEMLASLHAHLNVEINAGLAAAESQAHQGSQAHEGARAAAMTLSVRRRLLRVLFNVRVYYAQFLPAIQVRGFCGFVCMCHVCVECEAELGPVESNWE